MFVSSQPIKVILENQNEVVSTWPIIVVTAILTASLSALFNYLSSTRINKQEREAGISMKLLEERLKAHQEAIVVINNFKNLNILKNTSQLIEIKHNISDFLDRNSSYLTQLVLTDFYIMDVICEALKYINDQELLLISPFQDKFQDDIIKLYDKCQNHIGDFFENSINEKYIFPREVDLNGFNTGEYAILTFYIQNFKKE
jgi:hypothetical protein